MKGSLKIAEKFEDKLSIKISKIVEFTEEKKILGSKIALS
jgi:hypothetical protein